MTAERRNGRARPVGRRLRFERLEDRSLLSVASPGQSVISDDSGHLFAVNVNSGTPLESLGTMDQVMLDIGFTPAGTLLGVKQITASGGLVTSGLFSVAVNLESPSSVAQTSLLGAITHSGGAVSLNSLDVRADGTVFAAGTNSLGHGYLFTLSASESGDVTANAVADLGSYVPAGDLTFDTRGNVYVAVNGPSAHLLKVNYMLTGVTDLGPTSHTDFTGLSHGSGYALLGFRQTGGAYTLNTATGASTLLTTLSGSGLTGIYGAAVVPGAPLSLGALELRTQTSQQAFSGNMAYNFTAAHTGLLTAELPGAPSGTDVQFTLYSQDGGGALTQVGAGSGDRVDVSVHAGQAYVLFLADAPATFDLRLANLVNVSGNTTTVYGTSGDDTFTFTAGSPYSFTINDVSYPYASVPAQTAIVAFDGGAGLNTAQLTGGTVAGAATLSLQSYSGSYVAPGIEVNVANTGVMTFTGAGADDTATLTGSPHKDVITLSPQAATILYPNSYYLQVASVPNISLAGGGSQDKATFTGGTEALTATVQFHQADFVANDGSYEIHVTGVRNITAKAGSSGDDVATMTGSTGNDALVATSLYVSMFSSTFSNACNGFRSVAAYGGGGTDSAQLADKANSINQFTATPTQATLSSSGYKVQVNQFSAVTVTKAFGSYDIATLQDSTGNDLFTSTGSWAKLKGAGYSIRVNGFDTIYAYSIGGLDTALVYGTSGDDTFTGTSTSSTFSNSRNTVRLTAFRQVFAYALEGGVDKAYLYGSAGADVLTASGSYALLSSSTYTLRAAGFDTVTAISGGGLDKKKIRAISYDLVLEGYWQIG